MSSFYTQFEPNIYHHGSISLLAIVLCFLQGNLVVSFRFVSPNGDERIGKREESAHFYIYKDQEKNGKCNHVLSMSFGERNIVIISIVEWKKK